MFPQKGKVLVGECSKGNSDIMPASAEQARERMEREGKILDLVRKNFLLS
jgi:hypothetical protein